MPPDFEQLIRQHGARIRRIARRYSTADAVEDLMQDILVRLWRSYPRFRGESKAETWIYRVALNASMTHVKHSIRERAQRSALAAGLPPSVVAPPAGSGMADILEGFLAQISDIDASILMMYLDGLSADEMSSVLGIAASAISVRITRLRQKFSETYIS